MKRNTLSLVVTTSLVLIAATLNAKPPAKSKSKQTQTTQNIAPNALTESANGWVFTKGEWVHPEGYKFVNGKILRTTAKAGIAAPKAPGKLALENAQKLSQKPTVAPKTVQTEAERKAEERRKNLAPAAPRQTGTNL